MTSKNTILILAVGTVIAASSCARKDSPVVVEQQAPAAASAPEPIRESSWRPVAVQGNAQKASALPSPVNGEPGAPPPPAPAAAQTQTPSRPAARVQEPMKVTLAAGTILPVRVGESLSSERNGVGDSWSGVLSEPVVVNGLVIADRGSRVEGRVTNVKRAGRVKGVANLTVALTRFTTADGQSVEVNTSSFSRAGADETKKDVGKVAIASGIGAAIGAIAGRGKGAAIGAGAGAGAGTGVVLATRGGPAVIATETLIRFRVADPVTITEKLR